MHIADVTMLYAARSGGVRRYLQAKRRWLRGRPGYQHTLVVPRRAAEEDEGAIDVPSMPLPFSDGYRLPVAKALAARTLTRLEPDVIEAGDPYRLAWAALEAGRMLRVPVVGFYHSDLARMIGSHCGRHAERLALAYVRRLYSQFDLVFAPSAAMVEKLRSLGIKRARFQPLGVDTATFNPQRRSRCWREYLEIAPSQRLLVYVGRFAPEKNLPVLLDAMKSLGPRYVLVMVGSGRQPPRQDNVRIVPYVGKSAPLAALMASCDAFVHAGDQETFGLAALEAMACGVPVVTADAGGLAELVDEEVGMKVPPRDPLALADAIETLFDRDVQAIGAAARRRAERYDWNRVLPSIVRRYAALRTAAIH